MSFTQYPLDTVVYITDTIGNEEFQGSGVLIAPDEVLTASHVVYSQGVGTATNIVVTPAYDGLATSPSEATPYGSAEGLSFNYYQVQDAGDEISVDQSQYDYAVIHLNKSFTGLGTMGLESNFAGGTASVTGYPAAADGDQITKSETVTLDPSYTVYDGTGLGAGSSGGPVWIDVGGDPYVVGLVSSGDNQTDEGYFTQITTQAYDDIESWVAQDNACFLQGSRIATVRGDVPVEALTTDDLVLGRFGGPVRVKWLGHRRVACRLHPRPHDVMPVRVAAHAFGPDQPRRDLFLSPDHAVAVRGALIPVRYLVNGATIVQQECETAVYWHVELPHHDVLLAENLPAESYLDTGNRGVFDDGGGATVLHPDFSRRRWKTAGCAPLVVRGPRLAAARRRLAARAAALGYGMTDEPGLTILADGRPVRSTTEGTIRRARLPAGTVAVRLASRVWVPAHATADTDARRLGIAISRLWLDGREVALDSPSLSAGWHEPERAWRWTNGHAVLATSGVRDIAFEIAMAGKYWLTPPADRARNTA